MSEFAAYSRIAAARVARRFPIALVRLADGGLTLTTIGLLAPHLTDENNEALFDAAQHASRRDVERLVASLYGQPDIPASVRRLPEPDDSLGQVAVSRAPASDVGEPGRGAVNEPTTETHAELPSLTVTRTNADGPRSAVQATPVVMPRAAMPTNRDVVAPLAVGRYLLRVTIGAETHARLDKARDLLRHVVPNGDLSLILDRALAVLLDQLERRKTGRVTRPRRSRRAPASSRGRHIPAAVKREVSARDANRCAFVGTDGRCAETAFLEYHHVVPYAKGGKSEAANIQLRCRAHNAYEATRDFGNPAARESKHA